MGYTHVDPDSVEPVPDRPCELRRIGEAAGLDGVALNRFVAEPGEQIPLAYHYHDEQEEVFYVVSGTLAVETPERTYEIPAGDLFAVEPGSPQRAHNPADADEPVTVLALGVPNVSGEVHPYEGE
ncbi:MAG: cupin domain-containing protein [Halolamina sp.]